MLYKDLPLQDLSEKLKIFLCKTKKDFAKFVQNSPFGPAKAVKVR